jgi:thiol-disulfide isomerase/thioredoxin
MSLTPSSMLDLGTKIPYFNLVNTIDNSFHDVNSIEGEKGTLIVFICNHCPYVIHIIDKMIEISKDYNKKGIKSIFISSNNIETHPQDSPIEMKKYAAEKDLSIPYLYDESQETALKFKAACTPDFYLFDSNQKLVYRGRFDDARPGNEKPITGSELRVALENLLNDKPPLENQMPSLGCNIKWKKGNEPKYL